MTKANTPKGDGNKTSAAPQIQLSRPEPTANRSPARNAKNAKKGQRPQIGGTAITGARSTQPKDPAGTNPAAQQYDASNRTMRRRIKQMGTDPQSQAEAAKANNPRRKRMEKRRLRLEERREELRRTYGNTKIDKSLVNRRSLYVFLGVLALIVVIVVIAILVNHPFS